MHRLGGSLELNPAYSLSVAQKTPRAMRIVHREANLPVQDYLLYPNSLMQSLWDHCDEVLVLCLNEYPQFDLKRALLQRFLTKARTVPGVEERLADFARFAIVNRP